ncbi:hypothetical protein [Polaribacter sp. 20A6]|uniref:hypothetical protein n=1 Tax=Polaribacter sp. 20A6 TaxID=2687289 RepID=UPI0013FE02E8|nr:hypothetical protein [Polaribacter sp. 20A6]
MILATNGRQYISYKNCSTHCKLGIDAKAYPQQKGVNIIHYSCISCGLCSAIYLRGVLTP